MQTKKKNSLYIIFNCILILSGLIWIFTNLSFDEEYQMALANRFLQGDELFVHMWEPHQTSVFVCAFFMAVYKALFKSYTGVAIFLHAIGIVFRGLVSFALFMTLKKELEKPLAFFAAAVFFMISPKDFAIPEYSNIQVWLSVFCFAFMLSYLRSEKAWYLVASAVALCLEVITYPSCIITAVPAVFVIAAYASKGKKIKAVLFFGVTCFVVGAGVLLYLLIGYGFDTLLGFYQNMVSIDPSHNVSFAVKFLNYLKDVGRVLIMIAAALAIALFAGFILFKCFEKKASGKKKKLFAAFFVLSSFVVFLAGFLINILSAENRCAYSIIFVYVIAVGFFLRVYLSKEEKRIFDCGCALSIAGFVATLMLTNLPFIVSGAYLVLAVALSALPIKRFAQTLETKSVEKCILICGWAFICLLFLRCIYLRTSLTGREQLCSIVDTDMSLIRSGPAKGMITDDAAARKQQISYEEFKAFVPKGSKIWIADGVVDTLGYLYDDYYVATPSSISDPKYLPGYENYWRENPDKTPDVIICGAYNGELSYDLLSNEWFMYYLENVYKPARYTDGVFWRYYFKE